jgi:hypothetical protein
MFLDPSEGDGHLLDANNVKFEAQQFVQYVFCRGVLWQVAYHRLHRFFGFGVERVIGHVISVQVGFDGSEFLRVSRDDSGSVSGATELKVFFDHNFQLLLQLTRVSGRR